MIERRRGAARTLGHLPNDRLPQKAMEPRLSLPKTQSEKPDGAMAGGLLGKGAAMFSPLPLELLAREHHHELLREAEHERLVRAVERGAGEPGRSLSQVLSGLVRFVGTRAAHKPATQGVGHRAIG